MAWDGLEDLLEGKCKLLTSTVSWQPKLLDPEQGKGDLTPAKVGLLDWYCRNWFAATSTNLRN